MTKALPSTDRSLPIALLRARERVMGPIRALLSDVNLTEQQWRVLRVVQESGPTDPTPISEEACPLLPTPTPLLHTLDATHLLRPIPDPPDPPRQIITTTHDA